jgi:hypothetical protein
MGDYPSLLVNFYNQKKKQAQTKLEKIDTQHSKHGQKAELKLLQKAYGPPPDSARYPVTKGIPHIPYF